MVKLQKMAGLVDQVEELVKQKVQFVESFPVDDLLNEDAAELLKEADLLVASQVIITSSLIWLANSLRIMFSFVICINLIGYVWP